MPAQANPLYGQTGVQGTDRFAVAGDLRQMYPVGAAGGAFSIEKFMQTVQNGSALTYFTGVLTGGPQDLPSLAVTNVLGSTNFLSNGESLFSLGSGGGPNSQTMALRLGVTTNSGGNDALTNPGYATIVTNEVFYQNQQRTMLHNGNAVYQDTIPAAATFGAAVEQFTTLVGGTVTVASGSPSIQGNATTFTTASLTDAVKYPAYVGNLPSKTLLQAGDYIRVQNTAGTLFSYHRIVTINAATGGAALTVTPNVPFVGAAVAYTLFRSGHSSKVASRVVSINDGSGNFFNYFVGSALTFGAGTIESWTRPVGGGTSVHRMAPQTTAAQDVKATDIAYYKGFLLYGNLGSISWSVAGFPTGGFGAAAFGAADFPAGNISVIDNTDTFIAFEYLGDQLIALFEHSTWEVQATGSVPEFNFFKIPEPVGIFLPNGGVQRSSVSSRNAVFYWSPGGLMHLTGATAKNVSYPVFSFLNNLFSSTAPSMTWEPSTDTVILVQSNGQSGMMYNVPTDTWSYLDMNGINTTNALIGYATTGDYRQTTNGFGAVSYSSFAEQAIQWDAFPGAPFAINTGIATGGAAVWATPVIGLGDEYGAFPMAGFQFDGIGVGGVSWTLYAGRTPYALEIVQTGTVDFTDNRRLLGKKIDSPFIAIVFTFSTGSNRAIVKGVNIYPEGRGK